MGATEPSAPPEPPPSYPSGDAPPPYDKDSPPSYDDEDGTVASYKGFAVRKYKELAGEDERPPLEFREKVHKWQWEFPGWGETYYMNVNGDSLSNITGDELSTHLDESKKLGQIRATSICGNDITSSCLYVAALSAVPAGKYAPIALMMVAVVLFLFRAVYNEVCTALPLNGGAYNVLLNTTSKRVSSAAACLTLLSYVATCVVSGAEAVHYVTNLIPLDHTWDLVLYFSLTVALLGFFAGLNIMGISESANVAMVIFTMHIGTMLVLVAMSTYYAATNTKILSRNWETEEEGEGDIASAIFFGFASAMLGISGFESSANYVEEQKKGVFSKTLRNMWVLVAFFNPTISFLSLCVLPLSVIRGDHKNDLLAEMAKVVGGDPFHVWVCVDAFLVLSGAVLTSYVGVTGLVKRMALDRCLPQIFLRENKWRKTKHWIILTYFAVCTSIFLAAWGEVGTLASVYNLSFLSVMALFAIGDMMLKIKRASLIRSIPSKYQSNWFGVSLAFLAVCCALGGNIVLNYQDLLVFFAYIFVVFSIVMVMLMRVAILRTLLSIMGGMLGWLGWQDSVLDKWLKDKVRGYKNSTCIFFSKKGDNVSLRRAAEYVIRNEQARTLIIVHVLNNNEHEDEMQFQHDFKNSVGTLDSLFPRLQIHMLFVDGSEQGFSPQVLNLLQKLYSVERNMMFFGTPSQSFEKRYGVEVSQFGGVRLIL